MLVSVSAVTRWAEDLAAWAIPEEILRSAPDPPWTFPVDRFSEAARQALARPPTPTHLRVAEVLEEGGTLLDVGSGAGAGSLPAIRPGCRLVAVDEDRRMLEALSGLAGDLAEVETIEGRWPDVADRVGTSDVVVCANVAYNVADLDVFVRALTRAARQRVVLELTREHPQCRLSPLWKRFWGLERPARPTLRDAVEVVTEVLGHAPGIEEWDQPPRLGDSSDPGEVAWVRRRLCLGPDRDDEVAAELAGHALEPSGMATLVWSGSG